MIKTKTNKFLWIFAGIFIVLATLSYNACAKYIPFFLHNTVYYCRQVIQSVTPQAIQLNMKQFTLWGLGALALYIVIKVFLTAWRIIQQQRELEQKLTDNSAIFPIINKLNLQHKVCVIKDKRMGAFCFGISKPKIYISIQMISLATSSEIEAVLRHEKYHLENNDTLVMLFAVFTESLFPFFPLVSDFIAFYHTHREIEADKSAIMGAEKGRDNLRSILTKLLNEDLYPSYAAAPGFIDTHTLEMRINTLIQKTTLTPRLSVKNVLISALSVMILGSLAMAPVQAIEYHQSGQDAVMACFSSGSCSNACQQNASLEKTSSQSSRLHSPVVFTSVSY